MLLRILLHRRTTVIHPNFGGPIGQQMNCDRQLLCFGRVLAPRANNVTEYIKSVTAVAALNNAQSLMLLAELEASESVDERSL